MNSRTLFFTAVLIAALALGAGLMLAQDDGGSADDPPVSAKEHSGFGRRGAMGRGFHDFGRGMTGRGFGMPAAAEELHALVIKATGLEMEALSSAMAEGSSLASLIEANGGDVAAFIAQATELVSARVNEGIAARIEAMVNGERPAGTKDKDMDGRGYGRRAWGGPQGFGGPGMSTLAADAFEMLTEATGLEAAALRSALAEGSSLASLIEANGGDVADFIAQASTAFNDHVDVAVADGSLSEERAALLKNSMAERIEALVNAEHEGRDGRGWRKPAGKDERKGGSAAAMDSGEESGTTFALDEIFDKVRNGVRLVISYDAAANAFIGTIENTTDASIQQVRVEVHLSNGVELGPTPTISLASGEAREVRLDANDQDFEGWSAHAETGSAEHSGEGEGEHGSEGSESAEG